MAGRQQAVQRLVQIAETRFLGARQAGRGCAVSSKCKHTDAQQSSEDPAASNAAASSSKLPPTSEELGGTAPPPTPPFPTVIIAPGQGAKPPSAPEPPKPSRRGFGTALVLMAVPAAAYIAYQENQDLVNGQLQNSGLPPLPPIPNHLRVKLPDSAAVSEAAGKVAEAATAAGQAAQAGATSAAAAMSKAGEALGKLQEHLPDWSELYGRIVPGAAPKAPPKVADEPTKEAEPDGYVLVDKAPHDREPAVAEAPAADEGARSEALAGGDLGTSASDQPGPADAQTQHDSASAPQTPAEAPLEPTPGAQEATPAVAETSPAADTGAVASEEHAAAAAAGEVVPQEPPTPAASLAETLAKEPPPFVSGALGVSVDIRRAALVKRAIERGYGPGGDWAAYDAQLRQATSDAAAFTEALHQALKFHDEGVAKVQQQVDQQSSRASAAEHSLEQANEQWKSLLQQQQQAAEEMARQAARSAEIRTKAELSEALNAERQKRSEAVDALRLKVDALQSAFSQRGDEARVSTEAHTLGLAVAAMSTALAAGKPLAPLLQLLGQSAAGSDPVVQAALQSLPGEVIRSGASTHAQLQDEFEQMKHMASELSYFPAGKAGLLATLVARLAANLKADERQAVRVLGLEEAGVDGHLAEAEERLIAGDLPGAAAVLEAGLQGTMAAHAVAAWAKAARARAVADQTLALLQAHGTALAASLT